jgi:co-chaperonin GroES (HSP10)
MRATLYFLVEVIDAYNNYETLSNGLEVMVNNTIESVENINRIGKVISAPKGTKANEGDKILFHHNICRELVGVQGKKRISGFQVKPNIYFVPVTEIFMIDKGDGWESIDPYVFIKPMPTNIITLDNGVEIKEDDYKGTNESVGIIEYNNTFLKEQGVKKGDVIAFQENSHHEYILDGELYYKMMSNDILAIY